MERAKAREGVPLTLTVWEAGASGARPRSARQLERSVGVQARAQSLLQITSYRS